MNIFLNKKKAFTLIELLSVIAIIALLTTIILVNMSGARGKAKRVKILEFSQTINSSIGDYAVGIWRFDEGSGNIAHDYSGYANNGTIYGASFATGTIGRAISFNGSSYVSVGNSDVLNVETGDDLTVEVWAKSNGFSSGGGIVSKGSWENSGYFIAYAYNPQCVFFVLRDAAGYVGKELNTGLCGVFDWSHIVGVKKGNNMEVWVNAQKVGELKGITLGSISNSNNLAFGKSTNDYYFNGLIDEVRIYKQALNVSQIQNSYAQGLRHKKMTINL